MTLDWSYNYHANNMHQQVAPTEIYVKQQQQQKPPIYSYLKALKQFTISLKTNFGYCSS